MRHVRDENRLPNLTPVRVGPAVSDSQLDVFLILFLEGASTTKVQQSVV
jgi:hypothetical protein